MSDVLDPLEARCTALLAQLAPDRRRALARELAQRLRQHEAARIAAQRNPDGSAYAPRSSRLKRRKGALRRTMFARLRTTRYLKTEATADAAIVTFAAEVQRIARVHQFGLRDRVNRKRPQPEATYPARELLGINADTLAITEEAVFRHLAA